MNRALEIISMCESSDAKSVIKKVLEPIVKKAAKATKSMIPISFNPEANKDGSYN